MPEIISRIIGGNHTYKVGEAWPGHPDKDKNWVVAAIFHRPGTEERIDSDSAGGLLELVQSVRKRLNGSPAVAELEEIESALGDLVSESESTREHYEVWKAPHEFFLAFFYPLLQALFYDKLAEAGSFFNENAIRAVTENLAKAKIGSFTRRLVYTPSIVDEDWPVGDVVNEMGERFLELGDEVTPPKPEPVATPAPT